jgi:hypothetical protein
MSYVMLLYIFLNVLIFIGLNLKQFSKFGKFIIYIQDKLNCYKEKYLIFT